MSMYDLMATSFNIKNLADQGTAIIKVLKDYLLQNLNDHLKITNESPYSLFVLYYGFQLIFRIEVQMDSAENTGKIAAYYLSYDAEPVENPIGVEYTYDRFGNIEQRMLAIEFPPHFISDVFSKMSENGSRLRP